MQISSSVSHIESPIYWMYCGLIERETFLTRKVVYPWCRGKEKTNNFPVVFTVPPGIPAIFVGNSGTSDEEDSITKHEMSLGKDNIRGTYLPTFFSWPKPEDSLELFFPLLSHFLTVLFNCVGHFL